MKGKDLSKVSVIRHFCRIFNTALFALVLCFTSNFAFAMKAEDCTGTVKTYTETEASDISDYIVNTCDLSGGIYQGNGNGWMFLCGESAGPEDVIIGTSKTAKTSCVFGEISANPTLSGTDVNYCWCAFEGFRDNYNSFSPLKRSFITQGWVCAGKALVDGTASCSYTCSDKAKIDPVKTALVNAITGECLVDTYTITLDKNGGTGGTSTFYVKGGKAYSDMSCTQQITSITKPTRNGYVFFGYPYLIDSKGNIYNNLGAEHQTLQAQWGYAVNLYLNCPGGANTRVTTIGVEQNKYMPETDANGDGLVTPYCPGYRFLGYWDQTSGGKQYYDHTLIINGDGEGLDTKWDKSTGGNLYAHWEEIDNALYVDVHVNANRKKVEFEITAAGKYYVDWGDGSADYQEFDTPGTNHDNFIHQYTSAGHYTVSISGTSDGYMSDTEVAAINFEVGSPARITELNGSFGFVFPTLTNPSVGIGQPSFYRTCYDCDNLTELTSGLFDGISGTPVPHMFDNTFGSCENLTAVHGQLFPSFTNNSISNAEYMFYETFYECSNLTTISGNLFAGIRGQPSEYMFSHTFYEDNLLNIPSGLFSGLNGNVTEGLFNATFGDNFNLASVPVDLLANIVGKPQEHSFESMFEDASEYSDDLVFVYSNGETVPWIPPEFFLKLDNSDYEPGPMRSVFAYTQIDTECPSGYEQYLTGFEEDFGDYVSCIQSCSGNKMHYNGTNCVDSDFTLTTTATDVAGNPKLTDKFAFNITAAGTWVVDWGDGHVQKIYRPDTADEYTDEDSPDNTTYRHAYAEPGVYTIKMKGLATDYSGTDNIAAINFSWSGYEDYIASITGSLGAMFPTLAGNNVPSFTEVFADAENFIGELPSGLFSGVTGCRDYMFQNAFSYGKFTRIPAGLFSGISEACESLFQSAFVDCTELTDVEQNAFPKLQYCGDRMYAYTFQNAEKLTTIPYDLFENQEGGCMELFENTFENTGLTSIPSELFANIENTGEAMFDSTFKNTNITEVPSDLFKNLQSTDVGLFMNMFSECDNLTTIPADLFKNLESSTSDNMFNSMFYNDANLKYFKYPNGTTVSYIPSTFFGALEESGYDSSTMSPNARVATNMFAGTDIDETCSAGMEEFNSVFKTEYAPKVSCVPVTAQQVAISYVLNGGTGTAPDDVCTIGETLTLPATPAKTGYNFTGWTLAN